MGIIYEARNTITGKSYIGQTINGLDDRKWRHYTDAKANKSNCKFHNAIRKYGKECWAWRVVLECPDEELDMQEMITVEALDTYYNGYNTTPGGDFNPSKVPEVQAKMSAALKGKKSWSEGVPMREESKRKLSLAKKGRKMSEETRRKLSEWHTGRKASPDTKAKMSASKLGKKRGPNRKCT